MTEPTQRSDQCAAFINEGHFDRHVRRMRTLYAQRQQVLLRALHKELPGVARLARALRG